MDADRPAISVDPSVAILFRRKSMGFSLILSLLLPGMGQVYNGQPVKGAVLIVLAAVMMLLMEMGFLIGFILYFVIWVYALYDAYKKNIEYNDHLLYHGGQPPW